METSLGKTYSELWHSDLSRLRVFAIAHNWAPLNIVSSAGRLKDRVYEALYPYVDGLLVLATCNRFEVYVDASEGAVRHVREAIRGLLGGLWSYVRYFEGLDAVRRIFRIACGLESAMIGEWEILGQVKGEWVRAKNRGYTSWLIDQVVHRALVAGRRARSETSISVGPVGYPQAAVELAARLLRGLNGAKVVVVGAGEAAKAIVDYLCDKYEPGDLVVLNRTVERARSLAARCSGRWGGLGEIGEEVATADAVFVAVSFNGKLVGREVVEMVRGVVVDLSTPPVTDVVEGKVYTLEDVKRLSEESIRRRLSEVPKVLGIIDEEVSRLVKQLRVRLADDAIRAIMRYAEAVASREVEYTSKRLERGDDPREALRVMLHSYSRKLLRPLMVALRDLAASANGEEARALSKIIQSIARYYEGEVG